MKKYAFRFTVTMMARVLSVSSAGYYSWLSRPPSRRAKEKAALCAEIKKVFKDEKGRAGAPRIAKILAANEGGVGRNRVAKIMRAEGLRAKAAKKFKATTNSNHRLPVAPNLLAQDFEAQRANEKWVSDITYIWTEEGWLYLAVVLDLHSRMVVGFSISERMTVKLVSDALRMALWRRQFPIGVIVHSDRGSTRAKAKLQVFEYIDVYYNRKRLHSKLGYLSPVDFEDKKVA